MWNISLHKKPSPDREWAFCVLRVDSIIYLHPARQGRTEFIVLMHQNLSWWEFLSYIRYILSLLAWLYWLEHRYLSSSE